MNIYKVLTAGNRWMEVGSCCSLWCSVGDGSLFSSGYLPVDKYDDDDDHDDVHDYNDDDDIDDDESYNLLFRIPAAADQYASGGS